MKSDNEVLKEKKQHTKKIVLFGGALLIIIVAGLCYLYDMNWWFFNDHEVAGLPTGKIAPIEVENDEITSLLIANSGGIKFNAQQKEATIYLDYYEYDHFKKQDTVTGWISDGSQGISSEVYWITLDGEDGMMPETLRMQSGINGDSARISYDFANVGWKKTEDLAVTFGLDIEENIKKGKKYYLQIWTANGRCYSDPSEALKKEALQASPETMAMYIVFE